MKTFNTLRVIFTLAGFGVLAGAFFLFQNTSTFPDTATARPYSGAADPGLHQPDQSGMLLGRYVIFTEECRVTGCHAEQLINLV